MRLSFSHAVALLLAIALPAIAQEPPRSYLVYVRVLHMDVARNDGVDTCLVADDNGQFRYEQTPTSPQALLTSRAQSPGRLGRRGSSTIEYAAPAKAKVYLGRLEAEKLEELKALVGAPELARVSPPQQPGNMVVAHAYDMIYLRIHREGVPQELQFISVDGRSSMPESVKAFIPWVTKLQKAIGRPKAGADPRDCSGLDETPGFDPKLQKR